MSVYPTTPAWSAPVIRTLEFATSIAQGEDGTEQRWMIHAGRESWTLTYPRLSLIDRNVLITAFETAQGAKDQGIDFTFNGTTYHTCYFDSDVLAAIESTPQYRAVTIKLAQVVRAPDEGSLPPDFPVLSTGARMQLPYTHERTFDTVVVRTEGGRYTHANRSSSLRRWTAGGTVLTDAEAQAIWDMFRLAGGRFRSFAFTDPDSGTRYTNCRFAEDTLVWRVLGAGQNSIETKIQQCL